MGDTINVAIIGGGRTGTPLLKELTSFPFINVQGVADKNPKAEGIQFARQKGIFTTTDPIELAKMGIQIDILIEVSGDPDVKKQAKEYYEQTDNKQTIIMHDLVARMFISVCLRKNELISSFHPDDKGIG